ncbi:hypothetical protein LB465_01915 [Salegentibacter sp. LM13S]|nr:hypothetical protein [Salegentibacter lacus]MBZ9629520.1 hypothetical protein [Salegentibacter lacus]
MFLGLTTKNLAEEKQNNKNSYNWVDIVVSILVVVLVIGVMIFFNGK